MAKTNRDKATLPIDSQQVDSQQTEKPVSGITRLLSVMAALREPGYGCPWNLGQDFETIAPYAIEEAYEVRDSIQVALKTGDMRSFQEELGDLLFQVIYQSQLAKEKNLFDFDQVAAGVAEKMIKRHPHVFKSSGFKASLFEDSGQQRATKSQTLASRKKQKQQEHRQKKFSGGSSGLSSSGSPDENQGNSSPKRDKKMSVLEGVPGTLPALMRAVKLQKRVASVGFDRFSLDDIHAAIEKKIKGIKLAKSRHKCQKKIGNLLFSIASLSQKRGIDPEEALRKACDRFETRFRMMEELIESPASYYNAAKLLNYWKQAKRLVRDEGRHAIGNYVD